MLFDYLGIEKAGWQMQEFCSFCGLYESTEKGPSYDGEMSMAATALGVGPVGVNQQKGWLFQPKTSNPRLYKAAWIIITEAHAVAKRYGNGTSTEGAT